MSAVALSASMTGLTTRITEIVDSDRTTIAVYQALRSCAAVVSHKLDMDQYCKHQGWRQVMTSWKDQEVNTTVWEFSEDGEDTENGPMRWLATKEAIQAVRDGMNTRDSQGELVRGRAEGNRTRLKGKELEE
jgi:hypothetical protein